MAGKQLLKEKLVKYNIRINILNGIAAIIALNLVSPYYAKFAERLGASDYQIAYLSSLPALISVFALIPGAILIESFSNRKIINGIVLLIHKFFYLLIALIPFIDKSYQPWLFVILIGVMNFPGSISSMGFQSSIGDIFDERTRGRAMGLRNRYSTIFGMIVTFLSGQFLSKLPNSNEDTIRLYQIFFIVAFIVAMGEVFSYFKFRGIKKTRKNSGARYIDSLVKGVSNLPNEKNFIMFMICSLLFHFGWQMGWPLFNIYTIKILEADEMWLGAISIAGSISSIATYTLWAKYADKKGNSLALSIATIGMSITPLLYAISKSLGALVFWNVVVGVSVAGTTQILFNILLDVTPEKNRTIYIAIYTTLINISASISPIIGVSLMEGTNIYTALIIVSAFRFAGSIAFFIRSKFTGIEKKEAAA